MELITFCFHMTNNASWISVQFQPGVELKSFALFEWAVSLQFLIRVNDIWEAVTVKWYSLPLICSLLLPLFIVDSVKANLIFYFCYHLTYLIQFHTHT